MPDTSAAIWTNGDSNREDLQRRLTAAAIEYVFLGKELGARTDDPDYQKIGGDIFYSAP